MSATVILFPRMRTPLILVVNYWRMRGWVIGNNRKGRLVLTKMPGRSA